jgi:hypothetical protein
MQHFKKILPVLACLVVLAACSKNEDQVYPADGGLAFYNASQLLQQDVQGNGQAARILLNANNPADTTYGVHMPDFRPSFGGSESQQFFPRKAINVTSPPWLGFMHIRPGLHELSFLGPDSSFKLQTTVQTFTNKNSILFLSDSLGNYQVTEAEENSNPGMQSVQLQVLHLSPDAGALQVWVNDTDWQTLRYRSQTGFRELATPTSNETFPLRVQVTTNGEIAGRTTINATPGHSYTLIINGYYDSAGYTDKHTGEQVSILPNFRLSVVRNK